jgi:hypothetical protein
MVAAIESCPGPDDFHNTTQPSRSERATMGGPIKDDLARAWRWRMIQVEPSVLGARRATWAVRLGVACTVSLALSACGGPAHSQKPPKSATKTFTTAFGMRREQFQQLESLAQNPSSNFASVSAFIWSATCGSGPFQQPTMVVVHQTRLVTNFRVTFGMSTANLFRKALVSSHCKARSIRQAFTDAVEPTRLTALIKVTEESLVPNLGYSRGVIETLLDSVGRSIRWSNGHPTNYGAKVLGAGGNCDFEIDGPAAYPREVSVTCLYGGGESEPSVLQSLRYLKEPLNFTSGTPAINWFDSQFQRVINVALSGSTANLTAHYSDGTYAVEFAYEADIGANIGTVSVFETPEGVAP